MADVALLFPPLVESNFGQYYPSTAVLAGYLEAQGVTTRQVDLNLAFASYLLEVERLLAFAEGRLPSGQLSRSSMQAVAARLLLKNRHLLIDREGRHAFNDEESPAFLLSALVRSLHIDPSIEAIERWAEFEASSAALSIYNDFYHREMSLKSIGQDAKVIGISVPMGPQLAPALALARTLQSVSKRAIVVLGGPVFSLMGEDRLSGLLSAHPEVAAVVRYEGEAPLAALVERVREGEEGFAGIPGVSCRGQGGEPVHEPPRPGPRLDDLPFAIYDREILDRVRDPVLGVVQSRGCYWGRCSYCDYVELYGGSPRFRTRTASRFVDEIEHLAGLHSVRRFAVISEALPPGFARRMSDLLLERDLGVTWFSFAMVDAAFSEELLRRMARAGCERLVIGMETMTDRVLRLVKKSASREDNIRFLQRTHGAGVPVSVNLIPDLPTTTERDAMSSLEDVKDLRDSIDEISVFDFEATRSSAIGRAPEQFGLQLADEVDPSVRRQSQYLSNHLAVFDKGMTDVERTRVLEAFHDFAEEHNANVRLGKSSHIAREGVDADTRLQLAEQYIDLSELEDGLICYHWITRVRFRIPAGWGTLLERIRELQPLSQNQLATHIRSAQAAEFLWTELLRFGLLIHSSAVSSDPGLSEVHGGSQRE